MTATAESFETLRTRALLKGSLEVVPMTADQARARLRELAADKDWTARVLKRDAAANAEYGRLIMALNGDTVIPSSPRTAADVRRDAELKYDSAIPQEVLDAIAEQGKRERA